MQAMTQSLTTVPARGGLLSSWTCVNNRFLVLLPWLHDDNNSEDNNDNNDDNHDGNQTSGLDTDDATVFDHIQDFWPEWCISTIVNSWDIPFWSETLNIACTGQTDHLLDMHVSYICYCDKGVMIRIKALRMLTMTIRTEVVQVDLSQMQSDCMGLLSS